MGVSTDQTTEPGWATLAACDKRERILAAAERLFAAEGLDAAMPAVAAEAGAGVASVYRQFPSKRDLLAALVVRHMEGLAEAAHAARAVPGSRWDAFVALVSEIVERRQGDDLITEAFARTREHPDVAAAAGRARAALEAVLADARAEGRLHADATTEDLELMFAATRAARRTTVPDGWRRMLALILGALDTAAAAPPAQ